MLLAAVAGLSFCRVKSPSLRHAVWTLVTAGMLVQVLFAPLFPEIPLRVLRPAEPMAMAQTSELVPMAQLASAPKLEARVTWEQILSSVYFIGLVVFVIRLAAALLFARQLVRTSEPTGQGTWRIYQSDRISAPMTIANKILLPISWSEWDAAKLEAVLAHEESHVRRRDWAIAVMARLNRCVFWFHPLAWWLERRLARLAEQACDDAALGVVQNREQYASALLEVARAIQVSKGRLLAVSNIAAPMAKEANVEIRLNRILD
jgi:beta-lactamase regulating signal transducer with metallopeptidase domain